VHCRALAPRRLRIGSDKRACHSRPSLTAGCFPPPTTLRPSLTLSVPVFIHACARGVGGGGGHDGAPGVRRGFAITPPTWVKRPLPAWLAARRKVRVESGYARKLECDQRGYARKGVAGCLTGACAGRGGGSKSRGDSADFDARRHAGASTGIHKPRPAAQGARPSPALARVP